jgi:hypothetical protein
MEVQLAEILLLVLLSKRVVEAQDHHLAVVCREE